MISGWLLRYELLAKRKWIGRRGLEVPGLWAKEIQASEEAQSAFESCTEWEFSLVWLFPGLVHPWSWLRLQAANWSGGHLLLPTHLPLPLLPPPTPWIEKGRVLWACCSPLLLISSSASSSSFLTQGVRGAEAEHHQQASGKQHSKCHIRRPEVMGQAWASPHHHWKWCSENG